jgi:hypothetical protein
MTPSLESAIASLILFSSAFMVLRINLFDGFVKRFFDYFLKLFVFEKAGAVNNIFDMCNLFLCDKLKGN